METRFQWSHGDLQAYMENVPVPVWTVEGSEQSVVFGVRSLNGLRIGPVIKRAISSGPWINGAAD